MHFRWQRELKRRIKERKLNRKANQEKNRFNPPVTPSLATEDDRFKNIEAKKRPKKKEKPIQKDTRFQPQNPRNPHQKKVNKLNINLPAKKHKKTDTKNSKK